MAEKPDDTAYSADPFLVRASLCRSTVTIRRCWMLCRTASQPTGHECSASMGRTTVIFLIVVSEHLLPTSAESGLCVLLYLVTRFTARFNDMDFPE
eukprot:29372-Eustigmatos_ZCMA.PRE.1